jgi:Domain of unknown function (DUF4365)
MRKRRTRQHIIEDLGFNHVERHILLAGFILRRFSHNDYGYDGMIDTFNEQGEAQSLSFMIQLKSTDNIQKSLESETFSFDLSKRDLELWLSCANPVMLVLFDAQEEISYYIDLQSYFKKNRILLENVRKFVRVYFPFTSVFNTSCIQSLYNFFQNN